MLAAISRFCAAVIDRFTGGLRVALEEQQHQIRILELGFNNQQRNIDTLNEMLVSARLRVKEVRDECIEDGLELKREMTDLKLKLEEMDERRA